MTTSLIALSIDTLADRGGVSAVTQSPAGASRFESFAWPFPDSLRQKLEQWLGIGEHNAPQVPQAVGRDLFEHIVPGSVRQVLDQAFQASQASERTLVAISSAFPAIHMVPFEISHNGREYLQTGNRIVFRHVNDGAPIEPRLGSVRRVLVVLAEPQSLDYPAWGHDEFAASIEKFLAGWGVRYEIMHHAKARELNRRLVDSRSAGDTFDVVLVVAHGEAAADQTDGCLVLENAQGGPEPLRASSLATSLTGHEGCTLILLSCSSAAARAANPLASIAHRAIHSGPVGAVVAMQRPVTVDVACQIGEDLLHSLRRNNDIFTAFRDGINLATISAAEHGTPCLYARLPRNVAASDESEEHLRLTSLFTASRPETCRFALSLPSFRMGLARAEFEARQESWFNLPPDLYRYRGATASRADLGSVQGIIALLGKLLPADDIAAKISIITDDELLPTLDRVDTTHVFVVGSRSHRHARPTLQQYSQDFSIEYDQNAWHIIDRTTGRRYSRPDPSQGAGRPEEAGDDFALIEKVVIGSDNRVIFFIAGLWDTSTLAAGQYLLRERRRIVAEFGAGGFQILLRVAAGYNLVREIVVKRQPTLSQGG